MSGNNGSNEKEEDYEELRIEEDYETPRGVQVCSLHINTVKELGRVIDLLVKLTDKVDNIYEALNGTLNTPGWLNRLEKLEAKVEALEED
jgi:hypothetical protein